MISAPRPTVLLADDEPDVRELAKVFLEMDGFDVIGQAANGRQALECYLELAPPPTPTVVLLDNRMPILSGLEAAEQILGHNPDQVVVLFSAHLSHEVEKRAGELGIAACVSKMESANLATILRGLLPA